MLLAFGNSLKLLHIFFNNEKISCGLWMLWITNQFQKWCIACCPFYWFFFIRKQCILGLLKGQKIVLFVINMVGSDVKAYGFCWFVKLILPFFLWLWRKRKVSTFITCAIKIFVYGAKGSAMKLNVILHFLMGNLVCSGVMRFFFFLKENLDHLWVHRGCLLVAFLRIFLDCLRFFNMVNLNALLWFKYYFLVLAFLLVPLSDPLFIIDCWVSSIAICILAHPFSCLVIVLQFCLNHYCFCT